MGNNFIPISSTFFSTLVLLWILLFVFLVFKLILNKFSYESKFINYKRKFGLINISYQKIFYLLFLLFLLTQLLPYKIFCSSSEILIFKNNYHYQLIIFILKYIIPIFTIVTLYFFVFTLFLIINASIKKKSKNILSFLSFLILFINLLFNLIMIASQALFLLQVNLLTITNIINFFIAAFAYILILRLFFQIFKFFFNFGFIQLVELTFYLFNYQSIKITSFTKINLLTFLKQLWNLFFQINENQENYLLLLNFVSPVAINNELPETFDFYLVNNEINKNNLRIFIKNKRTILDSKILKDYIVTNGWKMSLLQ